ncbi:polygalacturonase-like [Salvia miltiorrhiza]|uniref:polygalacturonase-like n=1 Tax=Salvia miltiorrhiza TaxID=226208 RepID=UPI0025AD5AB3|nr:polygalacturonase-like [Salvia miltiorrhiza]
MATSRMFQILILTFLHYSSSASILAANSTYNVLSYGAKSDGKSDCTKAFLTAWGAACAYASPATVYVPSGRYLLGNAYFDGSSCKNTDITIQIDGTLVAPSNYNAIGNTGHWLKFEKVTGVSIRGGTLDGQGANLWECKNSGKNCPTGATSVAFLNSNNVKINGMASLNSQMFHIGIDGCRDVSLQNIKISAPENSPNTDGIHVEESSRVSITNSRIATGDDCVSVGPGTFDLWVENITCGPGHGISIGSLGWELNEAGVENVTVKSCMFTGTQNGVRVKTWARPSHGFVRNIHYQHLTMLNAENPIIIDQNYCPHDGNSCPNQSSGVKISDVTYEDIHGTSATEVGVKLECSKTQACRGITLDEVVLRYKDESSTASCDNVVENVAGVVKPLNCSRA